MPQVKTKPIPSLSLHENAQFWSLVDRSAGPDACWPWMGERTESGYGEFSLPLLPGENHCRTIVAHRFAYQDFYEFDVNGYVVCHKCPGEVDRKWCCNPTHVYPGTPADNVRDQVARGNYRYYFDWRKRKSKRTKAKSA